MLIEERPHPTSVGVQRLHRFDNNYGASVIRAIGSYGYEDNLWELAVLKFEGSRWILCYDTPITDDVLGYLTDEEVEAILERIEKLNGT